MLLLLLLYLAIYFLPTIVCLIRKSDSRGQIFFTNLLLGWTVIGWIIALIWAIGKDKEYQK